MNGLHFDRHEEEGAVESFAQQIVVAGEAVQVGCEDGTRVFVDSAIDTLD